MIAKPKITIYCTKEEWLNMIKPLQDKIEAIDPCPATANNDGNLCPTGIVDCDCCPFGQIDEALQQALDILSYNIVEDSNLKEESE